MFCRQVTNIIFSTGERRARTLSLRWEERSSGLAEICEQELSVRRRYAHGANGRLWAVHTTDAPSPAGVSRAGHKAMASTVPLGVALPLHDGERGQLYAGLPLATIRPALRVNAQFDPLTGRQGLADNAWNRSLCALIADVWAAAALDMFEQEPLAAWRIIPIPEPNSDLRSGCAGELESQLISRARSVLPEKLAFVVGASPISVLDLAVEEPGLDGVLTDAEVARVGGTRCSPSRKRSGRCRPLAAGTQ